MSVWGPRFDGMADIGQTHNLDHLCAHQWVRCVELSEMAFAQMSDAKHHRVYYEKFVSQPVEVLGGIAEFLGLQHNSEELALACSQVRTSSVGKGRDGGDMAEKSLLDIMHPLLNRHHYL